MDEHAGHASPSAPTGNEQEHEVSTLDRVQADLAAVDRALERLDEGTYGRCATCGEPIDTDRLDAQPVTVTCTDHAAGP